MFNVHYYSFSNLKSDFTVKFHFKAHFIILKPKFTLSQSHLRSSIDLYTPLLCSMKFKIMIRSKLRIRYINKPGLTILG